MKNCIPLSEEHNEIAGPDKNPLDILIEAEAGSLLHRAINACGKEHWEVLVLANVDGFSAAEIGEKLGISEEAAQKRVTRARNVLKTKLDALAATDCLEQRQRSPYGDNFTRVQKSRITSGSDLRPGYTRLPGMQPDNKSCSGVDGQQATECRKASLNARRGS